MCDEVRKQGGADLQIFEGSDPKADDPENFVDRLARILSNLSSKLKM